MLCTTSSNVPHLCLVLESDLPFHSRLISLVSIYSRDHADTNSKFVQSLGILTMLLVPQFREEINMCWLEDLMLEFIIRKTTQIGKAGPSRQLKKVKRSFLSKLQRMEIDWPSS